jgi:hypothetical protein
MTATQITLNSTDTQFGTDVLAWAIHYGTKGSVLFDVITVPARDIRKGDMVVRFDMVCRVTDVTTARGYRGGENTRVYVSGNDWKGYGADEMVTVYRKAEQVTDLAATYYPSANAATNRVRTDARPLMIDGKRVSATVDADGNYVVMIGLDLVANGKLDGTEGNLNIFFAAEALIMAA